MHSTPVSLLDRIRQSPERSAWCRFVDLYTPLLTHWANRLRLDPHETADLIQDIFSILVEKLPSFRYEPTKSFRAWLKTLLMNRWRHQLRKRGRANEYLRNAKVAEVSAEEFEFEESEYRAFLVHRALRIMQTEFEANTWKACWEFVVNDRPADEVARELGISVNSVYLAKSRILRRLREELNGLLD